MEEETEKKQKMKSQFSDRPGGLKTPKGTIKAKRPKVRRVKVRKKIFRK